MDSLHHPVFRLPADTLLGLVVDLPGTFLHHVADVSLVLQHIRDPLAGSEAGIRITFVPWKSRICSRCWNGVPH